MEKTAILNAYNTIREKCPLVHCITNYVTVNDVANAILAIGASPIMADDINEAADITSISSALAINMGTLNSRTVESMISAGKSANKNKIPVVFDPVGAGASIFRNETAKNILEQINVDVLRGNLSEISFIAGLDVKTKGVDSSIEIKCKDDEKKAIEIAKSAARKFNCITAITGKVDIITDGRKVFTIENGVQLLSKVTGTGCMTTGITAGFASLSKNKYELLLNTCAGISAMGIAGEIAFEMYAKLGTGSFRVGIIDALSKLNSEVISERIKIYEKNN